MKLIVRAAFVLSLLASSRACAQYLFLDSNGDGASTQTDVVSAGVENRAAVWIVTDRSRDNRASRLRAPDGEGPTINSYSLVLRAVGGTVEWLRYTNLMPSMTSTFGTYLSDTDFYTGFGGGTALPPGRYHLGDLQFHISSGNPRIDVVDSSPIYAVALTSFGSAVPGMGQDNTLTYRVGGRPSLDNWGRPAGDWFEADGLQAGSAPPGDSEGAGDRAPKFAVEVTPNPANPAAEFRVTTTRPGRLRIALFDTQGRLIRLVTQSKWVPAGSYRYPLATVGAASRLSSGLRFYRVETAEKTVTGKLLLLK